MNTAALLRLDPRDLAGLRWVRNRARHWLTAAKRARKYRPHERIFDDQEAAILRSLVQLEKAAGHLLAASHPNAED